jgi:hypothetical protein
VRVKCWRREGVERVRKSEKEKSAFQQQHGREPRSRFDVQISVMLTSTEQAVHNQRRNRVVQLIPRAAVRSPRGSPISGYRWYERDHLQGEWSVSSVQKEQEGVTNAVIAADPKKET